ncbi:MAG TPA: FAD-dependent monooxygenase [Pyrinomonadaceae bacterium]|nr:FAD-dependent monooxygenase [Pyrinomonadaceae bacterium]
MSSPIKTEVLIVGAGPTGLSLACQLVRYGIDFVIVEQNETVTPYSKALGVHARTLEIYEQMGLAEPAVSQGTIAGKIRLLEKGEVVGELDLSHIGEGISPFPYMLVLEQSQNEKLLYEYLKAHGREVQWQTECAYFSQNASGVTATLHDKTGASQIVEAKYLVGCDGARSPIRIALGLSFEGSTNARTFYVADVEIDWKFGHDALHGSLARNAVVAFFPMPGGEKRWRIVGAFPEEFAKDEGDILYEEIEARIKEEAEVDLEITHVYWFSIYKIHTRHVEKFSSGRCFLAGDSAHIHTPAGGQGMNTGIQDAYNLAWKLALVLQGVAGEQLLETYNEERLPNAKKLVETTDRMFDIVAGTDWFVNVIRTTVFPPMARFILGLDAVKHRFFRMISQVGIRYRRSSLSQHEGDEDFEVKAGDRLPYFLVDGHSIYDQLRAPKFHLLTFSDGQKDYLAAAAALVSKYDGLVDHHVVPLYERIEEIFDTKEPFSVLLRPDNYIAYLSSDTSAGPLQAYLKKLLE